MSPADSLLAIEAHPLRVSLAGHRGRAVIDLRWQYEDAGRFKPTRRGVTIPASALPEVIQALEALKAQMVTDGAFEITDKCSTPKFNPHVYPSDF